MREYYRTILQYKTAKRLIEDDRFQINSDWHICTLHGPQRTLGKAHARKQEIEAPDFKHQSMSMVGSLNHLSTKTRPDVDSAALPTSRNITNPNQTHMDAVTPVYAYLREATNTHCRVMSTMIEEAARTPEH